MVVGRPMPPAAAPWVLAAGVPDEAAVPAALVPGPAAFVLFPLVAP
ncbi:hypothetical protein BF49_3867 [Bradyrhizobium sp.]|nr:hypothetical protein BF49_3867 [Bradyrhizobium sp.]